MELTPEQLEISESVKKHSEYMEKQKIERFENEKFKRYENIIRKKAKAIKQARIEEKEHSIERLEKLQAKIIDMQPRITNLVNLINIVIEENIELPDNLDEFRPKHRLNYSHKNEPTHLTFKATADDTIGFMSYKSPDNQFNCIGFKHFMHEPNSCDLMTFIVRDDTAAFYQEFCLKERLSFEQALEIEPECESLMQMFIDEFPEFELAFYKWLDTLK